MRVLFRKFPADDISPPGPGEVYLLPAGEHEAERSAGLANLVLKYGLDALREGPGPVETLVVDAAFPHPSLDEMLAATFARLLAEQRPVPGGAKALAQYAATLLQGLRPHQLAPEDSPEGIYLAIRNANGTTGKHTDLTDPAVAEQFLADWASLEARLLEAAAAGTNFAAESLFQDRPEFFKARGFLVHDRETYLADVNRGERWAVRLPGAPEQASGLYLHQPNSLLFPHWSRTDRAAPFGGHYLLLAVNWGNGVWVFSTDPIQRLEIGDLAAHLQRAERARDAGRADKDPWYNGRRPEHRGTVVGAPKQGSALPDAEVLRIVKKWARARRLGTAPGWTRKALAGAAAAVLLGALGLLAWAALENRTDRQGPRPAIDATYNGRPAQVAFLAPDSRWAPIKGALKLKDEKPLPAGEEASCKFRMRLKELAPRYARDHVARLIVTLRPTDDAGPLDVRVTARANDDEPQTAKPLPPLPAENARRFVAEGCNLKADVNWVALKVKNLTAASRRMSVEVEWAPEIALYLLSVGIAEYQQGSLAKLALPVKDAEALTKLFKGQEGKLFAHVYAKTLTNEQATRENLINGLDWLSAATPFDLVVVAISGHGQNVGGRFAIPAYDYKRESKSAFVVHGSDLVFRLAGLDCYGKLLVLNTCYSGGVLENLHLNAEAGEGMLILASCRATEETSVPLDWGYSGLTLALCEAIENRYLYGARKGGARPFAELGPEGILTLDQLETYVTRRVDELNRAAQLTQISISHQRTNVGFREIPIARLR
jgi:hypothetical protein